ncbi:MAG: EAL domain-containing protein [Terriglobales bacterium]
MTSLRDIPVSRKLAMIITVATTTAVLVMSAAFLAYDYSNSRREALEQLQTFGRIAGDNSTAAVAFNDARTAAEVLNTLKEGPEIESACTYDADHKVLAEYHRHSGAKCPESVAAMPAAAFTPTGAVFTQPIRVNEAIAGYIYVESNLSLLQLRRSRFVSITVAFLFISLMAGVLLGTTLQSWIVRPITGLASVMERVSATRDYALRAEPRGSDEIGKLVSGFNQMLTEVQESHARLKQQALNDELTGLPNRRLLADRLAQALAMAKRNATSVAVIYMDLDGFKLVNDTLGHSVGDLLLREVADRLGRRVRAADTFARIGGDEFTLVATSIRSGKDAGIVADALLAEFAKPFTIGGHELVLTASIGISMYPADALEAEQLVQQADTAMYVAKSSGKNRATFFSPEFGDAVRERLELENQLRGALERGELTAHYQPEFEVLTNRLVRFESLARWRHPTLGMIPPLKFIPIAEENGLIIPIGTWMLEQACRSAVRWQQLSESPVGVGVNVSSVQFLQRDFVETVQRTLENTGLDPKLLQLELTESVLMPGNNACLEKMAQLRALGVSLAVDDFGTGYSSLSYLPRLPFDCLKIDRSFLEHIVASPDPPAMMRSVADLAHNLKMTVIIEGVETTEQLALIRSVGCDEVQGYLFGRPTADPDEYLTKKAASNEETASLQHAVDL